MVKVYAVFIGTQRVMEDKVEVREREQDRESACVRERERIQHLHSEGIKILFHSLIFLL